MYFPVPAHAWGAAQMMAGIFFGPIFFNFTRSLSGGKGPMAGWKAAALWLPALYVCAVSLARILLPSASAAFAAKVEVRNHSLRRSTDVQYIVYTVGIFAEGIAGLAALAAAMRRERDPAARRRLASVFAAFLVMAVLMFAFNSLANLAGRRLDPNLSIAVVLAATGWVSISVMRNKAWKVETLLERISRYCKLLARELKRRRASPSTHSPAAKAGDYLTDEYIDDLCLSSILHDIGKVGIPDSILMKPGKLSDEEFEAIKSHTVIGGDVLKETEALNAGRTFLTIGKHVAYHHHEKWDGSGYPFGLKGDDIPLSARIVAIADVYDALMSERPYKKAFTHEESVGIIREGGGRHFAPDLVEAFLSIEGDFKAVARA